MVTGGKRRSGEIRQVMIDLVENAVNCSPEVERDRGGI